MRAYYSTATTTIRNSPAFFFLQIEVHVWSFSCFFPHFCCPPKRIIFCSRHRHKEKKSYPGNRVVHSRRCVAVGCNFYSFSIYANFCALGVVACTAAVAENKLNRKKIFRANERCGALRGHVVTKGSNPRVTRSLRISRIAAGCSRTTWGCARAR